MRAVWGGIAMLGLVAMAGCNRPPVVLFDGQAFKAKSAAVSDDKRDFEVVVRDAAGRADAAVKAARYQATLYCLARFGGSEATWADGELSDANTLVAADGSLLRRGTCVRR